MNISIHISISSHNFVVDILCCSLLHLSCFYNVKTQSKVDLIHPSGKKEIIIKFLLITCLALCFFVRMSYI